jgi:hypothetical protein
MIENLQEESARNLILPNKKMQIIGLYKKPFKGSPMISVQHLHVENQRILGNIKERRPITLLSLEQWNEALMNVGISPKEEDAPSPSLRRVNILISGYSFSSHDICRTLSIGNGLLVWIYGELGPCKRMDYAVCRGFMNALQGFRGGVYGDIISSRAYVKLHDVAHFTFTSLGHKKQ